MDIQCDIYSPEDPEGDIPKPRRAVNLVLTVLANLVRPERKIMPAYQNLTPTDGANGKGRGPEKHGCITVD